jgi:hypothetical protein
MDNALAAGPGANCARSSKEPETKAVAKIAMIADRPTKRNFILLLRRESNPFFRSAAARYQREGSFSSERQEK